MANEKLSIHAKTRNKERFDVSNKVIKEIMRSGYVPEQFEGPLHDYLVTTRNKGTAGVSVRVKRGIVVIYNRRSRKAITTYKVPDKYIPMEDYLLPVFKKKVGCERPHKVGCEGLQKVGDKS